MKKFDIDCQAVIMCGVSGSGKTHRARILEQKGFIRVSADSILWEKVGDNLYSLPKKEQKELFKDCRLRILKQFTELLNSGYKTVLDATNCKRSVRDEIRRICHKAGASHVFLYCEADEEKLWNRLKLRKGEGPDDLLVSREELSEYIKGFEYPQDDETDVLVIKLL